MPQIKADLISTIAAFSRASDLKSLTFLAHSKRVMYIAFRLGEQLRLDKVHMDELIQSALLHDIGIMTSTEQLHMADLEPRPDRTSPHCLRGYKLLLPTKLFGSFARNVLEHHDYYSPQLRLIPAILHVADRVDLILDKKRYSLWQVEDIVHYFQGKRGTIFSPDVVDVLKGLAKAPSFWLDLEHGHYRPFDDGHDFKRILSLDELEEIAQLMAVLVDNKSPFTADHSFGVATLVAFLATKLNMSDHQVKLMKIAGLLHDVGKLAIHDEILMHPGALSKEQRAVIKQHTYHSYHLINSIGPGAKKIAEWAAYHHERLDGTGYPFALKAPDLNQGARLMAVVDITQSLLEDRPYRGALSKEKVTQILRNNVEANHLDRELTDLTIAHLDEIVDLVQETIKTPNF